MYWTDKIRKVRFWLVVVAIAIAAISLFASHYLVRDLSSEERNKMVVWAQALRVLNHADEGTDLSLVLSVIQENNTIPVVVLNSDGSVSDYRNLDYDVSDTDAFLEKVAVYGKKLYESGNYIKVYLGDSLMTEDYQLVCYDDSTLLKQLAFYPYWQLGIIIVFVVVAIIAILSSKKAEQNKVWVGLSKETAHQLGTPISSLMAWIEILRENYPEDMLIPEMEKDVKRLELIAERFSKIGSEPELVETSMNKVLEHVVAYMDCRTSKKVIFMTHLPCGEVMLKINTPLFEWVLENLCKNAVDAIEGEGRIDLSLIDEGSVVAIEVNDDGKGIRKKDVKHVFTPGYTTKSRGWGLGLSLAKRIVEEYHHGRIYVKSSEVGRGTTFRIELNA